MELLNIEKFLFCVKCDFSIFQPSQSAVKTNLVFRYEGKNFTMTMNALYFFDNERNENEKNFLENILIFKIVQEEWYISDYEDSSKFIVLSSIKEVNSK